MFRFKFSQLHIFVANNTVKKPDKVPRDAGRSGRLTGLLEAVFGLSAP